MSPQLRAIVEKFAQRLLIILLIAALAGIGFITWQMRQLEKKVLEFKNQMEATLEEKEKVVSKIEQIIESIEKEHGTILYITDDNVLLRRRPTTASAKLDLFNRCEVLVLFEEHLEWKLVGRPKAIPVEPEGWVHEAFLSMEEPEWCEEQRNAKD